MLMSVDVASWELWVLRMCTTHLSRTTKRLDQELTVPTIVRTSRHMSQTVIITIYTSALPITKVRLVNNYFNRMDLAILNRPALAVLVL